MTALKLITSGDKPRPMHFIEQWHHTLPPLSLLQAEMAALKMITSGDPCGRTLPLPAPFAS
eukprot:3719964-Karenia_brevis.AAC.1